MRVKIYAAVLLACIMAGSHTAYAQQVINGATPTPLSVTGGTSGVSMTGQGGGGTLIVGTIGGPQSDIFTNNSSGGTVTNALLRAVSTDTSSQSNIVFNSSSNVYGALGVTNPGGPFFLNINGGNNGTVVNFNGSLYGTITTVSGTGALNFNSGATNITATNFAADGTISLGPNTTLIGALTTNTANTGTLALAGGSALTGAVGGANGIKAINVSGGSNNAGVSASISGAVNAYGFNLGTNTLNVGGALTIANRTPSGVINTTLASPTVYGKIVTTGAVNLGSTLLVNVAVPQTAFIPVGTQFTIVQAGSGTNGSVVTVVNDPTNPLYTFSAVPLAGTVAGQVVIQTTGIPLTAALTPPAGVILPPGQVIAAPIVPSLLATAGTAGANSDLFLNVLPALNAISDPAAIVNAVSQLAPSNSALAAPQVTFDSARAFQTLVSSQMGEGLCGPESQTEDRRHADAQSGSGDQPKRNDENSGCNNQYSGLWLKGFGYFGDQGAQGAFSGYDSTILGGMLGYDVAVSDDTRAGAGIGLAHSKINGKVFTNATAFTSYQATAYIAHDDGTWFAGGDVSYGRNNYSGSRKIAFTTINRTAFAKYSGSDITGFATAGRHFFVDDVTITPLASLQFTHTNLGSYTETGAGDINLQVAAQRYDMLESGLGATAARHFALEDGRDFVPELHLKWLHELANPNVSNTATFTATGATPFVTPGLNQSADTLNGGAGLTLLSCGCTERTWSVEGIYDFYWRNQNYFAHQVTLAAAYRF